jgi:hypothetical protein
VEGGASKFLFSRLKLWRVPRSVRDPSLTSRMESLAFGTDFFDWWSQTSETQFLLKFADGKWDIPWEWLFGRLKFTKERRVVSIARTLDQDTPTFAPSTFSEPLRTLILHGDNGQKYGARLDLTAESREIAGAWDDLEFELRDRIERPVVRAADSLATLEEHLRETKPHLIWFSGHGSKKGVLLKNGVWLDGVRFGNAISATGSGPRYAVLMACDTARKLARQLQPAVIRGLIGAGVLGVAAMQAPIGDVSSRILAREIFSGLGLGLSLEWALARARYILKNEITDRWNGFDWAAPVFWTSTSPVDRWTWNVGSDRIVPLQLTGRRSAQVDVLETGATDDVPDADRSLVQLCLDKPRVWLIADDANPELRTRWTSLLMAVLRRTRRGLLSIEFADGDPARALSLWAEKLHAQLLPGDCPDDVADLIAQISRSRSPLVYWPRLCGLAEIVLAIGNPPRPEDAGWFWAPLAGRSGVEIRSSREVPEEWLANWSVDTIVPLLQTSDIDRAIEQAPRLVRALAVLRQPLGFISTKLASPDAAGARSLSEWPDWRSHLIELKRGPIMPATTRLAVLAASSDEDTRTAHADCARMLYSTRLENDQVREEIVFHLTAAGDNAVVHEAAGLTHRYRNEGRPRAVVALKGRLGERAQDVPPDVRLCFAWAHLQLGETRAADYWLRRVEPVEPLDLAWKEGLTAEIRKANGDREGALTHVDLAIAECRKALAERGTSQPVIRALRNYQQDRARILHFLFYDRAAAAAEYNRLLEEWQDLPEARYDVAVVQRNYAECLRTLAADHNDERWLRAKDLLNAAEHTASEFPFATLLAEVLYEQYRVADVEQNGAAEERLEQCQAAARRSGHDMMLAIARAQAFWRAAPDPFPLAEWEEIAGALAAFDRHGWPVRTLLNGRIRAAIRLEADRVNDAVAQLEANQSDVVAHPAFELGTDRMRIAATAAGLDVLGRRIGRIDVPWAAFFAERSWAEEYAASEGLTSADVAWQMLSAGV